MLSDVCLTVIHLCALGTRQDYSSFWGLICPSTSCSAATTATQPSHNPRTMLLMAQKAWRQAMVWNAQSPRYREPDRL